MFSVIILVSDIYFLYLIDTTINMQLIKVVDIRLFFNFIVWNTFIKYF